MKRQKLLFKNQRKNTSYGGSLLKTRKGRSHGRPLAVKQSMHLILKSSKAVGPWSFQASKNKGKIQKIVNNFSVKYGVKIVSRANVGNHLHFHIKLSNRLAYKKFIRAITSAIAMAVTGASRWKPMKTILDGNFWDFRPFTRIVQGFRDYLGLNDYIEVNQIEGCGYTRAQARYVLAKEWDLRENSS